MVVNQEQITRGVQRYIDKELIFKSQGLNKFMMYMLLPNIPSQVDQFMKTKGSIFTLYKNEDGNYDLERLYSDAKTAMEKTINVEFSGIIFNSKDIDSLYNCILEG